MNISGQVEQTSSRAAGRGHVHSIKVQGQWYGGMWEDPGVNQGDTVAFIAEQNGQYWNVAKGSLQKTGAAPAQSAAQAVPAAVNTRDISIMYQSSRKDALQMLPILLQSEAVTFAKTTKPADKYDVLLALVDEIAAQNYLKLQDVIANGGVNAEDFIPPPGE